MDTVRLIIVAVGGQGNLLASRVLGEAALASGVPMRMSEIHGMAQRGGVVESALVFGDAKSSIISDGEADLLVGFEPCETLRALKKCHAGTFVVTSTSPLPPFTVAIGKGVYPDVGNVLSLLREKTAGVVALDASAAAREAGNVLSVNMVLLGALMAMKRLPLEEASVRGVIRTKTRPAFVESNLAAFSRGYLAAGEILAAGLSKE
jgi:indolepyruvate ferredoxin oxidoreductase, beta subunit